MGEPIFRLHQDLIGLRRRNPWLVHARTEKLELRNEFYRYAVHGPAGELLEVTLDLAGNGIRIQDGNGEPLLVSPGS